MLQGNVKDRVLQTLNILLGVFALALMGRGFYVYDGLAALGLVLLMTSMLGYICFRFSIQQQLGATVQEGAELRQIGGPARINRAS